MSIIRIIISIVVAIIKRYYEGRLTVTAAADVEEARLSAGAEALVGSVVRPVGEQRRGGHVSVERNALHDARPLVHQLHGPAGAQREVTRLTTQEGNAGAQQTNHSKKERKKEAKTHTKNRRKRRNARKNEQNNKKEARIPARIRAVKR